MKLTWRKMRLGLCIILLSKLFCKKMHYARRTSIGSLNSLGVLDVHILEARDDRQSGKEIRGEEEWR